MRKRELSFQERATWGECPVCKAEDGEPCHPEIGFALGLNVDGSPPAYGAHLGRLQRAPLQVKEVPA